MTLGPGARTAGPGRARAAGLRAVLFAGFWLLLAGPWAGQTPAAILADLAVGALAVGLATWASLGLLSPTGHRLRLGGLVRFGAHFLLQSFRGGLDLARRAFAPRLSLAPGYLDYPTGLRPGPGRAAFGALTSLVPGTLPVETDRPGALVYHCLDLRAPVAAGLARDEALMQRIWGPAEDEGAQVCRGESQVAAGGSGWVSLRSTHPTPGAAARAGGGEDGHALDD